MSGFDGADRDVLSKFHTRIAEVFTAAVKVPSKIVIQSSTDDWEKSLPGTVVFFEMRPKVQNAVFETLAGEIGGLKILFPFGSDAGTYPSWVAWSEEWKKRPTDTQPKGRSSRPKLDLIGVSLTFYAGNEWQQKTQVVRAEWDNPTKRGTKAAQPHWHIDSNLFDVQSWGALLPPMPTGLEELPPYIPGVEEVQPGFWSMQKLHFGMSGWLHAEAAPQCWQTPLGKNNLDEIVVWAGRVLEYCRSELAKLTAVR